MNAASGEVSFPADKLQVASISKSGSIMNLWVAEPSYSNSLGTVNFEGVVLNPGYTGSQGKLITINFRVKSAGEANLNFTSASVLANDGLGTKILSGTSGANFTLGEGKPLPPPTEPVAPSGKPSAPKVTSPTHPDETKWYNVQNARFTWGVPTGVSKARVLVDSEPYSTPSVVYAPAITEKEIISQTSYAYRNTYRGYGCKSEAVSPFCTPECPLNKSNKEAASELFNHHRQEASHG